MIKKAVTIQANRGLAVAPIANLVQVANQYKCQIYLETETKKINAKSLMGMMGLAALAGEELTISADGNDEEVAVQDMERFLLKQI